MRAVCAGCGEWAGTVLVPKDRTVLIVVTCDKCGTATAQPIQEC